MSNLDLNLILDTYGPQLGEMIWHSVHSDLCIATVSIEHANRMHDLIAGYQLLSDERPIRILEIGAYAHFGVSLACHMVAGRAQGWSHDVSPKSLRVGATGAAKQGLPESTLVAGDFHNLPFNTGFFDLVFCASSVHHTYRPWLVLSEMMRVVRAGGVVRIENEPVGREACFYLFRGNRQESRTEFETQIENRGLTWTVSSPFPGARQEGLFGMIENDRIPLSIFVNALREAGTVDVLELIPQVGPFERRVLDLPRDNNLPEQIYCELSSSFEELERYLTESDTILGFDLPPADKAWALSYRIAERLRQLDSLTGESQKRAIADLFGATLRATIVKLGDRETEASAPFMRELRAQDGVFIDLPRLPHITLEFGAALLPEIESATKDIIEAVYSASDWIYYEESPGLYSILNRREVGRISLPAIPRQSLMLARFYAVARKNGIPYVIQFVDREDNVLSRHVICQSESCLGRFLISAGCDEVVMKLKNLDGTAAQDLHCYIHLAVARMIPVDQAVISVPETDVSHQIPEREIQ